MASVHYRGTTVQTNTRSKFSARTHEGAIVPLPSVMTELRRTASACLLFEGTFYESGQDIAKRLYDLVQRVPLLDVLRLAQDLRHVHGLRHAPLWLLNAALDHPDHNAHGDALVTVLANVCGSRGDMPGEMLAMYRKDNPKRPIAKVLQKGLATAVGSLSSYALQKYAARGAFRLRDVMFLTHPKPRDKVQTEWFEMLAEDKLPPANTWETRLSAGANKRETWEAMLRDGTLGSLAILRNLRNMQDAGVPMGEIVNGLRVSVERSKFDILPFQFVAAARAAPLLEPEIERSMLTAVLKMRDEGMKLPGHTIILVDVSGSMRGKLSEKSTLNRSDAAGAMAILLREVCEDVSVFDYNDTVHQVPARRGFALRDAFREPGGWTATGQAAQTVLTGITRALNRQPDRIIVITDEQSRDTLPNLPSNTKGYIMNVSSDKNGLAWGRWVTISGFSENLVKFICEVE
jgi:60 kDa SS-A/Ro ribonucleoprotein